MYQSPPFNCIVLVHLINGHILFSCLPLPHFAFSQLFHDFIIFLLALIGIALFISLFLLLKWIFTLQRELSEAYVLLEVTPPSDTKQTTFTTEQFITSLYALGNRQSFIDNLLRRKKLFALELVSSKDVGIRYVLRVPLQDTSTVKRQIQSFLPGVKISVIPEYVSAIKEKRNNVWNITELTLKYHFTYPLQEQKLLSQYDPIAYFTGQMTQLKPHELILIQLVITPVMQQTHRKITSFIHYMNYHISKGVDATVLIKNNNSAIVKVLEYIFLFIPFILLSPFTIIGFFLFGSKNGDFLPFWLFRREQKKMLPLNPQQQETQQMMSQKIKKELFETATRIYVLQENTHAVKERVQGLLSSFQTLHTAHQVLKTKPSVFFKRNYDFFKLQHRLLSLRRNPILSVSELANIFHFPYSPITHTEDLVQSKFQELPAPLSLKREEQLLDITFAQNVYANAITPIGLTQQQRQKHMAIIGGTSMGKTTLLNTMIDEDIKQGKGLCLIDPHGDLLEKVLSHIPKERFDDVILFDPDDTEYPIGLNILSLPENLSKEALRKYKTNVTSTFISLFQKLFPLRTNAHRMEHILRMSVLTVLETEQPTLFTIQQLLTDYKCRKQVVDRLKDPVLIQFWKKEFNSMGSFQRTEMISPITNKLGKFLTSHMARNMLGQKVSTLSFPDIINSKKILLCDVSKGKIGEDMSAFFGALITAQIQLAALQRARIPEEQRSDFYLYIDEFQNFATPSFSDIMSEARKYKLYAIFAHQTTAQIEDKSLIEIILANTGTIIAFRTGSPMDEAYFLPFFTPEVDKGQIPALPPYNFYIKITDSVPPIAFTGTTIKKGYIDNTTAKETIRDLSRKKYAKPREIIEKEIQNIFENTVQETVNKELLEKAEKHYLEN